MTKQENVFIICAHNDDQVIGCGGTIAKYSREGKKVYTFIFSHGELSHPWLKPEVVKEMRSGELKECNRILGGQALKVFGVKEGKFAAETKERNVADSLAKAIKEKKPSKIFTHSPDDPHPDHRSVLKTVEEVVDRIGFKGAVYTFGVWNPIRMKKRDSPRLIIDTTDTFSDKIKAFKVHKSQTLTIIALMWNVVSKDIINGILTKHRYAEVFFKLK